jgi:carbonic anhydrase
MEAVNPTTTNAESYYAYDGSFTAPPCAEGVSWRILKNPLPVAAADLGAFTRLQGKNDRPTQPLNGRSVLDSSLTASQL